MRKFKVGDKVRVIGIKDKEDNPLEKNINNIPDPYKKYLGKIDTISEVNSGTYKYRLEGDALAWCDEEFIHTSKIYLGGE